MPRLKSVLGIDQNQFAIVMMLRFQTYHDDSNENHEDDDEHDDDDDDDGGSRHLSSGLPSKLTCVRVSKLA